MPPMLEVIEGPDAGKTIELRSGLVIGRDADADVTLHDQQVSRRHLRVSAEGGTYIVEDLGSSNGTFLNGMEVYGRIRLDPNDELLLGTTVLQVRSDSVGPQASGVLPVPPALAVPPGRPDFVERLVDNAPPAQVEESDAEPPQPRALESLVDRRVKAQARLAPLALLALVVLVVVVALATK